MIQSLIPQIVTSEAFINQFNSLLEKNIGSQFHEQIKRKDIGSFDIKYLLKCADVLSFSNNYSVLDKVLRICQATITDPDLSAFYRDKAIFILQKLGNYPLISLANSKGLLEAEDTNEIGLDEVLIQSKIELQHTNFLPNGNSFKGNAFQNSFWNKASSNQVLSVSAPTAAGKSFIFCQKLLEIMLSGNEVNILYLVPTRALVSQVSEDIKNSVRGALDNYEVVTLPNHEFLDTTLKKVFVFTQERLHFLLGSHKVEFDYIFVDEAHKLSDSYRGVLLQHAIFRAASPKTVIVYASPFSKNPQKLLDLHSNKEKKDSVYDAVATVNQNLFWVNQIPKKPKNWNIQYVSEKVVDIGELELSNTPNSELKRLAFIAHNLGKHNHGNLVYVNIPSDAEKVCNLIVDLKIREGCKELEIPEIQDLIELCEKTIHKKFLLGKFLKYGVAFHYGNIPQLIRGKVEELFKLGHLQFLVCTSTLVEGVNLSCKNIFVRGPRKGRKKNMAMTSEDFWNLAGRAGRWGQEFQGNVFCIDVSRQDLWPNGKPREREPYEIKPSVEKELRNSSQFIDYVNRGTPRNESAENINFEYLLSYLVEGVTKKDQRILDSVSGNQDYARLIESVEMVVDECNLPHEIYQNNPGVSPIAIDEMHKYFLIKKENGALESLIPPHPASEEPVIELTKVLARINKYLSPNAFGFKPQATFVLSMLITKWMNGYSVARLISDREKYLTDKGKDVKINALIRSVLEDIENVARFRAPKYLSCYNDILKHVLAEEGKLDLVNHLGDVQLSLEFGVNIKTQLSMISIGLSRTSAIELSSYASDSEMSVQAVIKWIQEQNLEDFDLPKLVHEEIKLLLKELHWIRSL